MLPINASASTPSLISGKDYVKMLEKITGEPIDTSNITLGTTIGYADACVLAERADVLKNRSKENDSLKKIKENVKKFPYILESIPNSYYDSYFN